ncbi:MAG: GDSL-type esterase/lipase family protein, partial [Pseudomonadota bacterium]
LLLSLLAACDGPRLTALPPDATVLAFGDSLTFGNGAPAGSSYPEVLAELSGLRVVNAGVPGELSTAGRERLPGLLEVHRPALVLLVHGGNDTLRRLDVAETKENLRAMIATSRASGAQVLMLGVPGRNLRLSAADYYREVAENAEVPIDVSTLPELMRDRAMKSDPVHFNAQGYRRVAEAVFDLMHSSGALP